MQLNYLYLPGIRLFHTTWPDTAELHSTLPCSCLRGKNYGKLKIIAERILGSVWDQERQNRILWQHSQFEEGESGGYSTFLSYIFLQKVLGSHSYGHLCTIDFRLIAKFHENNGSCSSARERRPLHQTTILRILWGIRHISLR